jgi:hypothetical protein
MGENDPTVLALEVLTYRLRERRANLPDEREVFVERRKSLEAQLLASGLPLPPEIVVIDRPGR